MVQRPDAGLIFGRVRSGEMCFFLKERASFEWCVPVAGQSAKERPGCVIVVGHGGDQMGRIVLGGAGEQGLDHVARESLAARPRRYRDLPDEQGLRISRWAMARHPTHDSAIPFGDDAMVGEVGALDQVTISGIAI